MTPELAALIRAVEDALAVHVPGRESSDVVDIPKLHLADALIAAVAEQSATRLSKLSKLPTRATPAVVPVLDMAMRPKRRRRA